MVLDAKSLGQDGRAVHEHCDYGSTPIGKYARTHNAIFAHRQFILSPSSAGVPALADLVLYKNRLKAIHQRCVFE